MTVAIHDARHSTGGENCETGLPLDRSACRSRAQAAAGSERGDQDSHRQRGAVLAKVVRALVAALEVKDPYTCGHSDRVARFAVRIALEMRCHPHALNTIYLAGLLHDVGKIGICDEVLGKADRLTDAEYQHVKSHPELGHRLLVDLEPLAELLPGVLHHHEQWNGRGYPQGLRGDAIPLIARILAVADAFDAMTSDRPYRAGMSAEKADSLLLAGAGEQWDPAVVRAFSAVRNDIVAIARQDRAQRRGGERRGV